MSSKTLSYLIRAAVISVAICGLIACIYILPTIGTNIAENNPEHAHSYIPWLIFLWLCAIPCFIVLACAWKVAAAVERDTIFTLQTAWLGKFSAILLFGNVGFFFAGNIILVILNMSHPGVLLMSLFVDVFGILLALIAAALSRYITKAAVLQEEADSTI